MISELKQLNIYKLEGEDWYDNEFGIILHIEEKICILITLTEEEINKINLAALEKSNLDFNVDDDFMNKIFHIIITDNRDLTLSDMEKSMDCSFLYSGTMGKEGYDKLLEVLIPKYNSKVSIKEFEEQVYSVEGVRINVCESNIISEDRLVINPYFYTEPMEKDASIIDLKEERIEPLIDTIVIKKWW